jgi:hypothetical protein
MSLQSFIYNPSTTTSAATGDGFSVPRNTTAGRLATVFTTADRGMMIYDTTLTTLCLWNGTAWEFVTDNSNGFVSVKDFGAKGDGVTSDLAAFQTAVNSARFIFVPSGTYVLNGLLTMSVDNTTLWLASNVTLLLSGYTYNGTQVPFGNQIDIRANNCSIIGSGQSSLLQITGGSQANAVGIYNKYGMLLRDLTIDGDKANVTAITDDTFESGVSIIAGTAGGVTVDSKSVVQNCIIRNWCQYGINIYGDKANGVKVVNCQIYDIGNAAQPISVGGGIAVTNQISDLLISNNVIKNCKQNGIFLACGKNGANHTITGNIVTNNTQSGIAYTLQLNYGDVANQGYSKITVTGNDCSSNGVHGIIFATNANVGKLSNITCTGNVCKSNAQYGILAQSNVAPNNVSNVVISGNECSSNTTAGIGTDVNCVNFSVSGNISNDVPYYQQGTWTPVIFGTTAAGVGTYTTQQGTYTKQGNIVFIDYNIDWTAHTGTGLMKMSGFPFTASGVEPQSISLVAPNSLTVVGNVVMLTLGGTTDALFQYNENGITGNVAMDPAANLRCSGFYRTA